MKKLFVISFVFICLTTIMLAYTPLEKSDSKCTLGVFGGLNIPRLSGGKGNELSRDYTSRSGLALGLAVSLDLGSGFTLRADGLYSGEGGKRNGIQAIEASSFNPLAPAGTYLYASFNNESILNYAEIPVMIKYSVPIKKSSKFYVNFGPYVGFLLNARQKTRGSSIIYADRAETIPVVPVAQSLDANTDITDSINTTNFGLTGGVGFTQSVFFGELFLDFRGAYGLTIIQKYKANGSSHNGNLLLALGYSIPF